MKPRNTLIIVAIFAALLGYLYFVELNKTDEQISATLGTPTAKPQLYMFQLNPDEVQTVTLTDLRFPRTVKVTREGDGWMVLEPIAKRGDSSKLDAVATTMTSLRATRVLTNVTDLTAFGLNPATLEARMVMSDTRTFGILLGNKTTDGNAYYIAYTGDKSKVFLVDPPLGDSLKALLESPPFEPPTPTPTLTPTATPVGEATPTATPAGEATPASAPPGIAPTFVPPAGTPKP